jgi:bifunctional non-homologous end joining protein LigD
VYKSFGPLRDSLRSLKCEAILDGEIVVLDGTGRPQFYDLLRRRGEPVFYAFDCVMHRGRDIRALPLLRRKAILERIVRNHPRILLARHFERDGCALFRLVCEQDLEGIVAKRKDGAYGVDWLKIRNPAYSQYEGRHELFERRVGNR